MAMEVLTKGPILDWTSDGKLHERFLEWKKKVSVLCKGLKMTKADPEFTCLCIYQWSGERGQNILDKATFVEADLKRWEKHLEKLEEHCKPRGRRRNETWNYLSTSRSADKLPTHVDGQRTPKTWLSGMQFSLDSKIQLCIRSVWKRTKIRLQRTGSSRLPPTSTIAIVKDRLCRLSAQHRQQPQPYNKVQLRFTTFKRSTEKMDNQERVTTKMTLLKTRMERGGKTVIVTEQGQLIQSLSVQPGMLRVTAVVKKDTIRSVAKASEQNQERTENSNKLKYMACRHN